MKKIIIIIICVLFQTNHSFSQDIIYKTDGSEMKVKVLEIGNTVVKYRNFDQPGGPLRNIDKNDLFMIIYEDGTREKFPLSDSRGHVVTNEVTNDIKQTKISQSISHNQEQSDYIEMKIMKAKALGNTGSILMWGGLGFAVLGLLMIPIIPDNDYGVYMTVFGTTAMLIGIPLTIFAGSKEQYWKNQKVDLVLGTGFLNKNLFMSNKSYSALMLGIRLKI